MKKNMRMWVRDILDSDERRAFPLMAYTGMDLTGSTIHDVLRDGKKQAACIRALASRYPSAALLTVMDLSAEAEAFGSETRFIGNETPTITGKIVTDLESACALEVPAAGSGRTAIYLEAAEILAAEITDRPVFGCMIGPFSLTGRLCGMTEALMNVRMEPEMLHVVLRKCTEFLAKYARAFSGAGLNGIVIAEPAAGLISPSQCDEFSSRYVENIIQTVQDDEFMAILHNCGSTARHAASMASTGAMGLHFGNAVDMGDVLPQIPSGVIASGNLDPARILKDGTGDDVRSAAAELLEKTSGYKNFILSSGCDIPPGTPLENIDALFEALAEYNAQVHGAAGRSGKQVFYSGA